MIRCREECAVGIWDNNNYRPYIDDQPKQGPQGQAPLRQLQTGIFPFELVWTSINLKKAVEKNSTGQTAEVISAVRRQCGFHPCLPCLRTCCPAWGRFFRTRLPASWANRRSDAVYGLMIKLTTDVFSRSQLHSISSAATRRPYRISPMDHGRFADYHLIATRTCWFVPERKKGWCKVRFYSSSGITLNLKPIVLFTVSWVIGVPDKLRVTYFRSLDRWPCWEPIAPSNWPWACVI